ncbi:DNA polymerase III subunit delta [Agitococcus lubricus]|uniref:DNA polymerase III subunit delta n=1 Tax=Agitococcus lubricus TaxID=1077255 RepID=A0A2T5J1V0_9GAMM|nr:DNA polymerase III subunit delta [Agitococcus lubricus]PTQ90407.1 DNA polymerase III delta subunit [Agitococcus lubricus]
MKYDYWGLVKHLKHPLRQVYVLHGDEILLQQEALIALRQAAQQQGFSERERHDIDKQHDWSMAFSDSHALSLFADKKLIEIYGNKPDAAGAKVIEDYVKHPIDDNVVVLVLPKLDSNTQKSKWFSACDELGVTVSCAPLSDQQFKDWLNQRGRQLKLQLQADALDELCQQTEGNLLAAHQELTKLSLLYGEELLTREHLQHALSDNARFELFDLANTALMGDASKTAKIFFSLKGEGQAESLILWVLNKEIRTLLALSEGLQQGIGLNQLFQQHGVWSKQQAVIQKALKRLSLKRLQALNHTLLEADKAIKGQSLENAWDILLRLSLGLAGVSLFEAII